MGRTNTHSQEWVRYHVYDLSERIGRLEEEMAYAQDRGFDTAGYDDGLLVARRKLKYWNARVRPEES